MNRKEYIGIGVMTGTSLDGIDIVACLFTEENEQYQFKVLASDSIPMEPLWHDRLMKLPEQNAEIYAKTHVYFGHFLGQHIRDFIHKFKINPDFVAVHGQTIFHQPDKNFTAQIGDGETLVTYLNCPLVCNFRNKDVALGGQGAPLVPLGEKYLFGGFNTFLNLGGFANLTCNETAFDVVPCNIVLNSLVKIINPEWRYDENGTTAASGEVNGALLDALNALPYFQDMHPKSLGWEWVEKNVFPLIGSFNPAISDALRTYTEHIAFQIAASLEKLPARGETMLVTGGGKHNHFLMSRIEAHLEKVQVKVQDSGDENWVDFKEAIVFAFLGLRTLTGKTNTLISVTGAREASVSGSVHLPVKGGFSIL